MGLPSLVTSRESGNAHQPLLTLFLDLLTDADQPLKPTGCCTEVILEGGLRGTQQIQQNEERLQGKTI